MAAHPVMPSMGFWQICISDEIPTKTPTKEPKSLRDLNLFLVPSMGSKKVGPICNQNYPTLNPCVPCDPAASGELKPLGLQRSDTMDSQKVQYTYWGICHLLLLLMDHKDT